MDKEVVLDNEYITIWYYHQKKIVRHEFHKFTHGKTLQDGLSKGAAILEKNRAQKWLSDDRKILLSVSMTRNGLRPFGGHESLKQGGNIGLLFSRKKR